MPFLLDPKVQGTKNQGIPCWKERKGDYVQEGHSQAKECYATLEEAKSKCLAAGDCKAIATQSNKCNGKFRVTHGGPTFRKWENWRPLNLRSYELTDEMCIGNAFVHI